MPDTTHIIVAWNYDYEQAWVYQATPGEAEGESDSYEVDIPADLWRACEAARATLDKAERAVIEAAGFDTDTARMAECCPQWQGDEYARRVWWSVQHDDQHVRSHDTREAAAEFIARLPERFWLLTHFELKPAARDEFTVKEGGFGGYSSDCHRCGWEREEHADA